MNDRSITLHDMILRVENTNNAYTIPLRERCGLIRDISGALVHEAYRRQSRADADEVDVDENIFAREISSLRRLACTLNYTNTFNECVLYCETLLSEVLSTTTPPRKLRWDWMNATVPQRHRMLTKILAEQCYAFSDGMDFSIPPASIQFLKGGRSSVLGCISVNFDRLKKGIFPSVQIRKRLLEEDEPDQAVLVTHHEGGHYAFAVLASRVLRNRVGEGHSLHTDALLRIETIKENAIIPSQIYSAYRAQPEEEVCYRMEDRLKTLWLSPDN